MLYPFTFKPILKKVIWGGSDICPFKGITPVENGVGESWELSHFEVNYYIFYNGELECKSLDYLIRFLMEAAFDPKVDEIKITQYRVAENSAVINTLVSAAQNGKKVTVFVELKARFDEENNMSTAERMEQAGIRIIYSIPGLKVHAKVAVILRKDTSEGLKRRDFAYLSTGNFNEKTAKIYSDMALLTSNTEIIGKCKTCKR